MKLALSNLALKGLSWQTALAGLRNTSIRGIEIAPSLIWERPELSSSSSRLAFRRMIEESGFEIAGLQALLFNRNDLQIFGDAHARSGCLAQLRRMVDLCSDLGGTVVSFGSASNRKHAWHAD